MVATERSMEYMLWREKVANKPKHWVRAVTACNSKCIFCLDSDTPRNVYLSEEEVKSEILRGREELEAEKIIISGGEASLHPKFFDFIGYAKEIGYDRVQTVTNGYMFGDRDFYHNAVEAGLGEITFSLHGHTEELHDHLTQTKGAFKRIMKAMIRAIRERKIIVNVDVVINKQNVGVLDKIIELCIGVGVTEFDLLHVIPQAAAFDNRDELFYDPTEFLPVLRRVFQLTRHPRFVIWTNRFPVPFLEDLEDLIQDPHKMLDEVNGRRFHVRKYLDTGEPLNCRQPERCVHCFIEPFCTTMERTMTSMNQDKWEVWWVGDDAERLANAPVNLPYGCTRLGVKVDTMEALTGVDLPGTAGLYAEVENPGPIDKLAPIAAPTTLVATSAAHLDTWLVDKKALPEGVHIEIQLTAETGAWMLANRDRVESHLDRLRIHQPSHEHLIAASENDYREPRAFFEQLGLRIRTSGLPACLAPGVELVDPTQVLWAKIFDGETGRLAIRDLARYHVTNGYMGKSLRCRDCRIDDRCDGGHINFIRDQGLRQLQPLKDGAWPDDAEAQVTVRWPEAPERIAEGMNSQSAPKSLPGFPEPGETAEDPLAMIERKQHARRERMKQRASRSRSQSPEPSDG